MSEHDPSRRRLLTRLGGGLAAANAGCLGSDGTGEGGTDTRSARPATPATPTSSGSTPPDGETPAEDECEPTRPDPTTPGPDGLEPTAYPALPAEPTTEDAASFASAFERAHTTNAIVAGTSTLNVPRGLDRLEFYDGSTDARTAGPGHLVTVSFSITYEDDPRDETPDASGETPSPAPTGHTGVSARYYVTGRFALRRPEGGGSWRVVACR